MTRSLSDLPSERLTLIGPHLVLRIPRADDAAALYRAASDPLVTRWFSWGPYTSQDQAASYLARLPGQRERGEQLDLVIEHLRDGVIGVCGLGELSARDRRATIGTWLGRAHWGTGANFEAKALMCHLAFAVIGLQRLGAYANIEHLRSQRALLRLGFEREGVLRSFHRHDARALDVVVFSLLRDAWEEGPLRDIEITVSGAPPPAFAI